MTPLDVKSIEQDFFKSKNPLKQILAISLDLLGARHSGLLYGTDKTHTRFLPSSSWDRGVMDRFDGRGLAGWILRLFGNQIVTSRGLSPVFFYRTGKDGRRRDNHGIIAYVLRHCADYYKMGINVIICPDTDRFLRDNGEKQAYRHIPFFIYNGKQISKPKTHIRVDTRIVRHFQSSNSIYIILPDYGIMVINTADRDLLELRDDRFIRDAALRERLDILIRLVETSSLAYLGRVKGQGAELLWRKEEHLRKAYADLSENEKKFRDLYENAPIAYFSMDREGRIRECNRRAELLSGYPRTVLVGKSTRFLFSGEQEADQRFKTIWETLNQGLEVKDLELPMIQKNGDRIWVSLSIEAVWDRDGQIREMRAMAMDISMRKTLEKQLFHAQKMEAIGTLARGIAHDFNNILSPVSGYAQMMLMDGNRNEKERERIRIILDCTRHAKDLVNQILTFSRQTEHRLMLVNPGHAVAESMVLIRSFLPASIKIHTRIDEDAGFIMADPIQVHQIIMNLATNSYHSMASGGRLDVTLSRHQVEPDDPTGIKPGTYVCLSVRDSGDGIAPELLPKIFEPYFTTKENGEGSGIGLSVVHGIVRGHRGDIRVESVPGQGSCFFVYFPVCSKGDGDQGRGIEEETLVMGSESVLLVDDDPKVALMHTRLLERLGYTVVALSRSTDALEAYRMDPEGFDLVITDYTMPDMDGIELAREIRALDPDQPVLLCTGLGRNIDEDAGAVVTGILSKPVELPALSDLIRQALAPKA